MRKWQILKGIGILLLLIVLAIALFHCATLYGEYLKMLVIVVLCVAVICVLLYIVYTIWRFLKDFFDPNIGIN